MKKTLCFSVILFVLCFSVFAQEKNIEPKTENKNIKLEKVKKNIKSEEKKLIETRLENLEKKFTDLMKENLELKKQIKEKKALKIGFVNFKEIFAQYKKVKFLEQSISRATQMELKKIKQYELALNNMKKELALYRPDSKLRAKKEKVFFEKSYRVKYEKEKIKYFFQEKMKNSIREIYEEITKEVGKYAKERNYHLIIKISDGYFTAKTAEALRLEINTRNVIFWNKKDDITMNILLILNRRFMKKAKKNQGCPFILRY